jgi:hypothetical protein
MKYILIIAIFLGLGIGAFALAQESSATTADEAVNLDENVQASDLNVGEPTLLPDSPFYFLKNWAREIQSTFTFNTVKKAELRLKFANEKAIEMEKVAQKTQDPEIIKKAIENYQQEVTKVEKVTQKIKEKAGESEPVAKFLDKFIQQQTLQQKVLQNLQEQVPAEVYQKIEQTREEHLEKFGAVMAKLEDKEGIQERLENNLQEVKGSEFKEFKNLEILKGLELNAPLELKETLQNVQQNSLIRLKDKLESLPTESQERFSDYIEKIGGNKEKQVEIIENLKEAVKEIPALKQNLLQTREKILEKVEEKIQNIQSACPSFQKPTADFCPQGRTVIKKDEKGCIVEFKCVVPAEIEIPKKPETSNTGACITLWNPVCGANGKTYSNACFAKLAGVEVAYSDECKEKQCQADADCPQLKCGPVGTVTAKCTGIKNVCVEGECKTILVTPLVPQTNQ